MPRTFSYQWQYLDGTWQNRVGATSKDYTPVQADEGFPLRLRVTPSDGTTPAYSNQTDPVIFHDYYVDSVNGSDANNGTTPLLAFQTIDGLPALSNGDSIGLACGSTWREQLTITVDNVRVAAYGAGAKPILDCSEIIAGGSWTKTGGRTNVYQAAITPDADTINDKTWINVWENGAFLTRATSEANCDATAGSYWVTADNVTSLNLYIHPNGSTNPISDGKTYEYSERRSGIYAENQDGITVDGLQCQKNLHENGSIFVGVDALVMNCAMYDGSKHNCYARAGSEFRDCDSERSYYNNASTHYVIYEDFANGETATFTRCTASEDAPSTLSNGFTHHTSDGASFQFGDCVFEDCEVTNCNVAYDFRASDSDTFTRCVATDCTVGFRAVDNALVANLTDCQCKNTVTSAQCKAVDASLANVVWTCDGLLVCFAAPHSAGAIAMLQNCTVVMTNAQFAISGTPGANRTMMLVAASRTVTLTCSNNKYGSGWIRVVDYPVTATVTFTSDNNEFGDNALDNRISGTNYTTVAAYLAAVTPTDANSTVGVVDVSEACE
jgi:hypothetical protein